MTVDCPLCHRAPTETLLWQNDQLRIILANEPDYPALCRVIWHTHIREMGDLAPAQQYYLMHVVFIVEQALRQLLQPDKINLASLGNLVSHLHWHVIPRFHNDRHFPLPIWSAPQRDDCRRENIDIESLRHLLTTQLAASITTPITTLITTAAVVTDRAS